MKNISLIAGISILVLSCAKPKKESTTAIAEDAAIIEKDTINHGYNELAGDREMTLTVSDYNTDNPEIQIERPDKSSVETSLDTTLLFNAWTLDNEGPHADFVFSPKSFFVVDYDGNGDMPYELKGNHLKIYYNDFIQEGEILSVSKDSLKIRWRDAGIAAYAKWKDN
ncbi:hypothetical protein HYN59_00305 [Flavobacterium album]|uniref:Uncharacterized protein n=1 Tax=Flavobacterium album TaxID=2175091 RepID=A0A2S1QTJ1_9FLAO|nr:hypothetical protein [Flavobacterium album]AWH83649.1 hypothetical protein HYN59_00305 [Flavobacterium album]